MASVHPLSSKFGRLQRFHFVNMLRHLHGGHAKLIHATTPKGYDNDYIHAETMYNITTMTNRKAKFGTLVFGGVIVGIAIPLVACSFQQKKARGGV